MHVWRVHAQTHAYSFTDLKWQLQYLRDQKTTPGFYSLLHQWHLENETVPGVPTYSNHLRGTTLIKVLLHIKKNKNVTLKCEQAKLSIIWNIFLIVIWAAGKALGICMLSLETPETVSSVSCTALSTSSALIFNLFFLSPPLQRIKSYNLYTDKTLGPSKVWL